MKQYGRSLWLFLVFVPMVYPFENRYSQTFMLTRPAFFNVEAQQAGWHTFAFNQDCRNNALQIIPYSQHSFKKYRTKQYFLMKDKNELHIAGDSVSNPSNRDILASWINLPANFQGSFSLNPEQRQRGATLEYKLSLRDLTRWCFLQDSWIGVSASYNDVKNDINFAETTLTFTTDPGTIYQAFNQSSWLFGKFKETTDSTAIGEVRIGWGTRFIDKRDWQFGLYTYASIPGEGPVCPTYIFPAYTGFNGHYGWGTQINIQMPLSPCNSKTLVTFFIDADNVYLFKNKKRRQVDLRNKPWSRYLLFNSTDGQRNLPGANVLTPCMRISPYNVLNISFGGRASYGCVHGEIAYGFWTHGDEKVRLKGEWQEKYGIAGTGTHSRNGVVVGNTASASTINYLAPNDVDSDNNDTFIPIKKSDLDFDSASSRATLSQIFQANIGVAGATANGVQVFMFAGGLYEYAYKNCTLSSWGWWVKLGASF